MSLHGCSVDTALPESFIRERLFETRGEQLYHHCSSNQQQQATGNGTSMVDQQRPGGSASSAMAGINGTSTAPQIIPSAASFIHHHLTNGGMSPPTFGSLIDLYRNDPVDSLFSSIRISSSSSSITNASTNSYTTSNNTITTINKTSTATSKKSKKNNDSDKNLNNIVNSSSSSSLSSSSSSIITSSENSNNNSWSTEITTVTTDREECKKRSSSLKSSRTNGENTHSEKKIVRFADVLGLDLADVHTFLDEIPRIPKSAFRDLKNVDLRPSSPPVSLSRYDSRSLVPLFSQPAAQGWFTERLAKNKICLENAFVTNTGCLNIRGTIRVVNLDFEKKVVARYTCDKWRTNVEIICTYVDGSPDGYSDRFGFTIPASNMNIGQRIEFALMYGVCGEDYWDNNSGANYSFQCVPEGPPRQVTSAYLPSTLALETWGSFY